MRRCMTVPAIGAEIGVSGLIVPCSWKAAISASVLPRMVRRLRTASSDAFGRARSARSDEVVLGVLPFLKGERPSPRKVLLALLDGLGERERVFATAPTAAIRSFCACTMSVASIVKRACPFSTMSPASREGGSRGPNRARRQGSHDPRRPRSCLPSRARAERHRLDRLHAERRPLRRRRHKRARCAWPGWRLRCRRWPAILGGGPSRVISTTAPAVPASTATMIAARAMKPRETKAFKDQPPGMGMRSFAACIADPLPANS